MRTLSLFIWLAFGSLLLHADPPSLGPLWMQLGQQKSIEVPDGTYTTKDARTLEGLRGTEQQPIMLRAANRGWVRIVGEAGLILRDCEHVVIEGFVFENDADQQSVMLVNCRQVRITRNVFQPKEREKPRHWEHWVTVEGANSGHNRIDHNLFERKANRGSPLFIRGDDEALVCSQHDRVDHNHFRDVVYANRENGHETLRTGGNDLGASGRSSFTVIERNLFEHCSGEDEIVSLKSSDNVFRHNTLINCRGAICFRLGNRNMAEGNFIAATEEGPGFGGIKLYGFEHRVIGNYFAKLTGTKHEAPFSLFPGMHDTPTTENIRQKYDDRTASAATRCVVTKNIWVDCAPLQMGLEKPDESRRHLPVANTFTHNVVVRSRPHKNPIVIAGMMRETRAADNRAYDATFEPSDSWTGWFLWESQMPTIPEFRSLRPGDVGPAAP